jgi:queuosine precursor transporter
LILMKEYRFFTLITGLFVAVVLISNIASSAKWVSLGPLSFDAGTILFPISYIFGDIFTEVYGYRKSRQIIWIGFACSILMALVFFIVGLLPAATGWENQDAYNKIFATTPRLVLGSLIAFFAGEFSNSYILAKMKILTRGRWLFTRTIGSTIVGESLDSALFVIVSFAGLIPVTMLITGVISNIVFKIGFEVIMTPITYAVINFLKKREKTDVYDYKTNFNPFLAFWHSRPGAQETVDGN